MITNKSDAERRRIRWSVVLPARDAAETLGVQLDALVAQLPTDSEIIVVDNKSTDATASVAESLITQFRELYVVQAIDDCGAGYARNVGASVAEGEYLLFVDADDVVAPGWFDCMSVACDRTAIVGGNIDFSHFEHGGGRSADGKWTALPTSLDFLPWAASANLAVRRDVFEAVGGFDRSLPRAEDIAFCWAVQLLGHEMTFAADSVVWYRSRPYLGDLWRQAYGNGRQIPALYLRFRHQGARAPRLRSSAKRLASLVVTFPYAAVNPRHRREWTSRAGYLGGQIVGSWRARVLCI
jgi:glycosyltransferase involved in cell wall biosynthesis